MFDKGGKISDSIGQFGLARMDEEVVHFLEFLSSNGLLALSATRENSSCATFKIFNKTRALHEIDHILGFRCLKTC